MNLIYPLDYLCENVNFNEVNNFNDMNNLITYLQSSDFKSFIKQKSKYFVVLNEKNVKDILCEENILNLERANWFYENIFDDIVKTDGKIEFKPKIIYSVCEKCKNAKKEDLEIKLYNLTILKVKYISLKSLLKIIEKYKKMNNLK